MAENFFNHFDEHKVKHTPKVIIYWASKIFIWKNRRDCRLNIFYNFKPKYVHGALLIVT